MFAHTGLWAIVLHAATTGLVQGLPRPYGTFLAKIQHDNYLSKSSKNQSEPEKHNQNTIVAPVMQQEQS